MRSSAAANSTPENPLITVRGLSKVFDSDKDTVWAIDDISFTVNSGEFVTVVGPSGCGKSTLLQVLAGLMQASDGTVHLNGEAVTAPRPDKIGVIFQDAWLLPWKTAIENIEFPLALRGVKAGERHTRAMAQLELVRDLSTPQVVIRTSFPEA